MPEADTTPPQAAPNTDSAAALLAVLDAYLADKHAGKAPDRAVVLAAHPELAERLESCLAALDFIHRAERPDPAVPTALGDFRVLTEEGVERHATKAHVAYAVTDLAVWRARLAAAGVEILDGIPIPGYARFEFRDPFGNRVELIEALDDPGRISRA